MALKTKSAITLAFEPQRDLAFGSIGASYSMIGTPLDNPSRILFVQNLTDANLQFSLNGTDDHFPLASNGFLLLDVTTNKTEDFGFYMSDGSCLYVKNLETPTSGSVYVTSMYGGKQ